MLHSEKKILRTSLENLSKKYSYVLIYQTFPMSTSEKEQIKLKILQTSPKSIWKLSTKFQKLPFKGPLFYVFNNTWENLQIVYKQLESHKNIECIGGKYDQSWISIQDIDVIFQSRSTLIVENLHQKISDVPLTMELPYNHLINILLVYFIERQLPTINAHYRN